MLSLKALSSRPVPQYCHLVAFTQGFLAARENKCQRLWQNSQTKQMKGFYCLFHSVHTTSFSWSPTSGFMNFTNKMDISPQPGHQITFNRKASPGSRRYFSTQTVKSRYDIGGCLMTKPRLVGSYGVMGIPQKHHPKTVFLHQIRFWSSSDLSADQAIYKEVVDIIKNDASNIMVMCGAGISTPSGIPDFRSPGTGLYHNLQKYNLPYPEAIFDIHYFMMDPRPFFTLAQDLYPGIKYKPNIVHYFMRLLLEKKKLQKVYTQNIDGLERMAGIPEEKLMEAHGTFSRASCTLCGKNHPSEKVKEAIVNGEIPVCEGSKCKGKVKPDIVFFGENLPVEFWNYHQEADFTDLLLVIGTSLEVYPFAGIAEAVGRSTPRVLINRDIVGTFGTRHNDFMLLGDLEDTIKRLAEGLEWMTDLENLQQDS